MTGSDADATAAPVRDAVRAAVAAQAARYQWSAISEHDLTDRVLAALGGGLAPAHLTTVVVTHYTAALHEACSQQDERRERGYADLFRYLYRAAHQRWPDHAEEIVARAMELVYRRIADCAHPAAFLAFALFLLRAAARDLLRRQRPESPIETAFDLAQDDEQAPLAALLDDEGLEMLARALQRLPTDQRDAIADKYLHGLDDTSIARRLDKTPNHVRVLRCRGIKALRVDPELGAYFRS